MNFIEWIKSIFAKNKKTVNIITMNLKKVYGEDTPLEIAVYENKTPIVNKPVEITINGRKYTKITNNNGIAKLNINLPTGNYAATINFKDDDYDDAKAYAEVTILAKQEQTRIEGTNIEMIEKDGTKYQCAIYDKNNNRINGDVQITVNGVKYTKTTDSEGLAKLAINLPAGKYVITAEYFGDNTHKSSNVTNEIIINPRPIIPKNHYGYWVFGRDMLDVDLSDLQNHGVTDLFLNYYAINAHGKEKVIEWINQANKNNIHIHIWVQSFYDGEWHNPANTDLTWKINEIREYANIKGVYGLHLDYLRYPGNAYKTSGATEAVTNFTKRIRDENTNVFLSCAVMPESDSEYYYGQDIQALGSICDTILPMQYKGNYEAGTNWLASTTKEFSQKATIWSGLQSYHNDDDATILGEYELRNDIKTCIANGANGAIMFRYGLSPNIKFGEVE